MISQSGHPTDEELDEYKRWQYGIDGKTQLGTDYVLRLIDAAHHRNRLAEQLEQVDWRRVQDQAARIAELEHMVKQMVEAQKVSSDANLKILDESQSEVAKLQEQLAEAHADAQRSNFMGFNAVTIGVHGALWGDEESLEALQQVFHKAALAGELAKALRALHHYETLGASDLSGRSRAIVRAARAIDRWDAAQKGDS